ncbi:hypothetical protein BGZ70_004813 [Mortierella alpina]|uniref:FHA domain-containing protein n=1 Tax=Mortierella alpina TaxID=64518 RepID=A0A9P6IQX9_MORAP|nr:hypothetical protein BGZ70_004813 [Mortierella alpina]
MSVPKRIIASSPPQDLVIHLEIQLQPAPGNSDSSARSFQPLTRRFIFENHARLLLGRSPSSQSNEKARDRQFLEADLQYGRAQAENGYDNGLFTNQVISKRHAALYEQDGQLMLTDLGSTHGTYVNGRCIEGAYELQDLDRVKLGRNVVRKDVPYEALEFTVRIQKRPVELRDLRADDGVDDELSVRSHSPVLEDEEEDEQDGGSPASTMELESESQLSPERYDWVTDSQQGLESDEQALQGSDEWVLDELDMNAICEEDLTILEAPKSIQVSERSQVVILEKTETEVADDLTQTTEVTHLKVAETIATSCTENATDLKHEKSAIAGKRKAPEAAEQPHTKRTALVAAALAGVVVGSVGTVFTLASF